MSCTRRICKGAKTVARGGARLLPVIIIPRREHHPPGERAGPERKGWKQAMDGTNPFETDLERGPANHVPLSPLSFLPRAAAVYPGRCAVVPGRSEERRVGNECVSTVRSRWSPDP